MKKLFILTLVITLVGKNLSAQILPITGASVVCTSSTITLTDATPGGIWSSSNITIATIGSTSGIVTGIAAGVDTITYTVGINSVTKVVTVNPTPTLTSSLTPPAICDTTIFNYTPMSGVVGTIFTWTRAFIIGIASPAGSGAGNPDELLINTTNDPIVVTYVYTLSAGGCVNMQNVTVTVNPAPRLSSTLTPSAICDSSLFNYVPTSYTTGTTFSWDRPFVTGITPATNLGTGSISEMLFNSTSSPIVVTYVFRLSISGCTDAYTQAVTVTVNPCPLEITNVFAQDETIKIYPNPSSGSFTIEAPDSKNKTTITISDMFGRVIETRAINANAAIKQLFNLYLSSGTYLIKISSDDKTYREKVTIW